MIMHSLKKLNPYLTVFLLILTFFFFGATQTQAIGGDSYPKELRVLEIRYFPAGNDYVYHPADVSADFQVLLEDASSFHKYSNPSATNSLDVNVVEVTEYQNARPNPDGTWEGSYNQIIADNNICQKINDMDIDQVWVWADPRTGYDETPGLEYVISSNWFMNPVQYATTPSEPFCNGDNSFVFFEFDYSRTADLALHSYGHYMEGLLGNLQGSLFWNNYSGNNSQQYDRSERCGNVHFPPNGAVDYDYDNRAKVRSWCRDWTPQGNNQDKVRFDCNEWGCTQGGFLKWWMQNMPNDGNTLTFESKSIPNWFDFDVDFDESINAYIADGTYYLNQDFLDANQPPLEAPAEIGEVSTAKQDSGTNITWDHTVSGTDPLLLVSASYRAANNPSAQLTNVTYGGQALTFVRRDVHNHRATEVWYLSNPTAGTATIDATWSADPEDQVFAGTTVTNVYNADPIATHVGAGHDLWDGNNPGNFSITVPSSESQVVIAALATYPDGGGSLAFPANDTAQIWDARTSANNIQGQGGAEPGVAGNVVLEWTSAKNWSWSASAVSIRLNADPRVDSTVNTDQNDYEVGTDTTAVVTTTVSDEYGAPITGLTSTDFVSTLNTNTVTVTFSETATAGTYEGNLDLTGLAAGTYDLDVTVTDTRALSDTASTSFTMSDPVQQGTTASVSSISYTTAGGPNGDKHITMTVTVVDDQSNPVEGANISLDMNRDSSLYEQVNGTTLADGTVIFEFRNAPAGCYDSTVTALTATGLTWDNNTPANQICK